MLSSLAAGSLSPVLEPTKPHCLLQTSSRTATSGINFDLPSSTITALRNSYRIYLVKMKQTTGASKKAKQGRTTVEERNAVRDAFHGQVENINQPNSEGMRASKVAVASSALEESSDDDTPLVAQWRKRRAASKVAKKESKYITPPTSSTPIPQEPHTMGSNSTRGRASQDSASQPTSMCSTPTAQNAVADVAPMAMFTTARRLADELIKCEAETAQALIHKEERVETLNSQLHEEKRKSHELGTDLHTARKKLKGMEKSLDKSRDTADTLRRELSSYQGQVDSMTTEIDTEKIEKSHMVETINQFREASVLKAEEFQVSQANLVKMRDRQTELEASNLKYAKLLHDAQEKLQKQQTEIDTFESKAAEAHTLIKRLKQVYMGKLGEFQDNEQKLHAIIVELKDENEVLRAFKLSSDEHRANRAPQSSEEAGREDPRTSVDTARKGNMDHFMKGN